jgi:hypothetical protein
MDIERWKEVTEHEHTGHFEEPSHFSSEEPVSRVELSATMRKSIAVYKDMVSKFEGGGVDEDLSNLFKDIKEKVLMYNVAIARLKIVRLEKEKTSSDDVKAETQIADRARKTAHDALIDSLNILSRYCHKVGVDNSWRSVIGLQREDVTTWARDIASEVR